MMLIIKIPFFRRELMLITLGPWKINRQLRGTFQHKNILYLVLAQYPYFFCASVLFTNYVLHTFIGHFLFVISSIFQHDMCMLKWKTIAREKTYNYNNFTACWLVVSKHNLLTTIILRRTKIMQPTSFWKKGWSSANSKTHHLSILHLRESEGGSQFSIYSV